MSGFDLSGAEGDVTEGVSNREEYIFITAYEGQKHISIRDVRLGLNPIELLPEKTHKTRHFGIVISQSGNRRQIGLGGYKQSHFDSANPPVSLHR
jgi:hypothetical protein